MSFKTTVGRVAMEGGALVEQPAGILACEPTYRFGRRDKRGSLYILAEVSGPAGRRAAVANKLAETVRDTYYEWPGSTTAGLQNALLRANTVLLAENRSAPPGERWLAGISAVALREDDLFVALAGPAAAFLVQDGQVTRFPNASPGKARAPAQDPLWVSLGERHDLGVDLFHAPVREGDVALLVHSDLARQLSPPSWADVLLCGTIDELLGALAAAPDHDVLALAVRIGEDGVSSVFTSGEPAERGLQTQPGNGVAPGSRAQPAAAREHSLLSKFSAVLLATLAALGGALLTLLKRMVPGQDGAEVDPELRGETTGAAGPAEATSEASTPDPVRSALVQKLLTAVAIAIPLIVVGAVLFLVVRRDQAQRAEIDALWQSASQSWQLAEGADGATARTHLRETEQILDQLLQRKLDHPEAAELQGRVRARLDQINQVRRITWVAALKAYPSEADLTRVVVQGVNVFVMDRESGRVYHHQLDEFQQALEPGTMETVLVSRGDQVDNVLVRDSVDMVWMPTGGGRQKAGLAILESGGSLLDYDPTTQQLGSLKVAASETWEFPKLVGSYFGRLYLLDTTASSILRYQPTADGYSSQPDEWLQDEADLAGVIDMSIGDSIYLLSSDGQIRKFSAGEPDLFDISDWDVPPESPGAIFARPPGETKSAYVADRGNNRLVQAGKDGKFQRQFRIGDALGSEFGEALKGVTGLFVDEIGGRAYFLSGQTLYLMVLPD